MHTPESSDVGGPRGQPNHEDVEGSHKESEEGEEEKAPQNQDTCRNLRILEDQAAALVGQRIDREQALLLWDLIPRGLCGSDGTGARLAHFGMSTRSRRVPLRLTHQAPRTAQVLARLVKQLYPGLYFTTITIREGPDIPPHKDHLNSHLPGIAYGLCPDVRGGGLWVECECRHACTAPVVLQNYENVQIAGHYFGIHEAPLLFSARNQVHATQPWEGLRRVVMLAYVPQGALHMHEDLRTRLLELDFSVPGPQAVLTAAQDRFQMRGRGMHRTRQATLREIFEGQKSDLWQRRKRKRELIVEVTDSDSAEAGSPPSINVPPRAWKPARIL